MEAVITAGLLILGMTVGSFLTVLIDRLPNGLNPFKGRSHCDYCHKTLTTLDLIPIVSFLFLGARCRYCHAKLSWQYPFIELITGIIFSAIFWYLLNSNSLNPIPYTLFPILQLVSLLIIFSMFLVIFVVDLKHQIIPDQCLIILCVGIGLNMISQRQFNFPDELLAVLISGGFLLLIFLVTRGRGMGFGDVKLNFLLALWLGLTGSLIALYLAFLTGAVISLILILLRLKKLKHRIAFGPFLVIGASLSFFWHNELVVWYTSLFK